MNAILGPLQGRTSLSKVFWLYGVVGSILVSALGLFMETSNEANRRAFIVLSSLFSLYVTVATYQCAANCGWKFLANFTRVCAVLTLLLIPVLAYMDYTGALGLALEGLEQALLG